MALFETMGQSTFSSMLMPPSTVRKPLSTTYHNMPIKVLREIISDSFPLDQSDTIITVDDSVMTSMFAADKDEDEDKVDDDNGNCNQIKDEDKENAPT